jgi:hypothetical protein
MPLPIPLPSSFSPPKASPHLTSFHGTVTRSSGLGRLEAVCRDRGGRGRQRRLGWWWRGILAAHGHAGEHGDATVAEGRRPAARADSAASTVFHAADVVTDSICFELPIIHYIESIIVCSE